MQGKNLVLYSSPGVTMQVLLHSQPHFSSLMLKPKNYTGTEIHLCSFDKVELRVSVRQDHRFESKGTAASYGIL